MNTVNILVEAKKEYTNQLQKILTPRLYEGFKSIYEDIINMLTKELEENKTQGSSLIKTFQKMLKEIPLWNAEMIKNEYNRILKTSNCDYFDDLIEAVFITNTKILTSVQINDNKSINVKINIPQPPHFIHKCYMECAKEIYKNPYIFDQSKNLTPKERHTNLRDILSLVDNSINSAIRDLLPIRDILKQGLTKMNNNLNNNDFESEESVLEVSEEEEEEEVDDEEETDNEKEEDHKEIQEVDKKEEISENNEKTEIKENISEVNEEIMENNIEVENDTEHNIYNNENIKEIILEANNNIPEVLQSGGNPKEKTVELTINMTEEPEIKEIVYTKNNIQSLKKFENIEKVVLDDNKPQLILESFKPEIKAISSMQTPTPTLFLKNIKNDRFLKSKHIGGDKNSIFYKKKVEQNSIKYNSMTDDKVSESVVSKVSRNEINLSRNSDDEEDNEIDLE
jgi:hypothetical protein